MDQWVVYSAVPARIFTVPEFDRFARKAKIDDADLVAVIERTERGLVDADLGGGLFKLRVARPGQGRSGGFRTIVAQVVDRHAVFLYGYAKNDSPSLTDAVEATFKIIAADLRKTPETSFDVLVVTGHLREVERP